MRRGPPADGRIGAADSGTNRMSAVSSMQEQILSGTGSGIGRVLAGPTDAGTDRTFGGAADSGSVKSDTEAAGAGGNTTWARMEASKLRLNGPLEAKADPLEADLEAWGEPSKKIKAQTLGWISLSS